MNCLQSRMYLVRRLRDEKRVNRQLLQELSAWHRQDLESSCEIQSLGAEAARLRSENDMMVKTAAGLSELIYQRFAEGRRNDPA